MGLRVFLLISVLALVCGGPVHNVDNFHKDFTPESKKSEVTLHKLCSWNLLEWDDAENSMENALELESRTSRNLFRLLVKHHDWSKNALINIPTSFAFYKDTVFVGVRRRGMQVYSTLSYFKISEIVNQKCPKLKPYPSYKLNEFLTEESSHSTQLTSVERFTVDKCVSDPKLWVFDTKAGGVKNLRFSFGEPALKVFRLINNTVLGMRTIPSSLYDRHSFGIVQLIVNVRDYEGDCDDTYVYLIDVSRGSLIVYSWIEDIFWRFDSPKFYGDAKYSDFMVTTPTGKQVKYYPETHLYEATVDLKKNELLYHARGSLSAYSVNLDVLHSANSSITGPTKFDVNYVGEKNVKGQTGSQAINNEFSTVWGIQEQNHAITCYNRQKPLTPDSVHTVVADNKKLSFLVDLKLEPQPPCKTENSSLKNEFLKKYCSLTKSEQISRNRIYVLTNNEKEIENGHFDLNYENFGIYFVNEDEALRKYQECLPQPLSKDKPPYTEVDKNEVTEEPSHKKTVTFDKELYKTPYRKYKTPPVRENEQNYYQEPYYKPYSDILANYYRFRKSNMQRDHSLAIETDDEYDYYKRV